MTTLQIAPPGRRAAGRVLDHLDLLTVTQRQVLVLHGAAGLSAWETARQTGLPTPAVKAIFRGAAQRLADATATPAPEVFRGSPENSSDGTNNPPEQGLCAPAQESPCPPWCKGGCHTEADGSTFHQSSIRWLDFHEGEQPDVAVARIDDADAIGETTVDLFIGWRGSHTCLTPEQALALAETLREAALTAAGRAGVEMSVEQARLGEEILTADNGWQPVETLLIDEPAAHVGVYCPDKNTDNDERRDFAPGDLVRVRAAVTS